MSEIDNLFGNAYRKLRQAFVYFKGLLSSKAVLQIFLWYFALLVPTIAFKYAYLDRLYAEGFTATIAGMVGADTGLSYWVHTLLFYSTDFVELFAVVVILYFLGHRLFRINADILVFVTVFLGLTLAASNWLALEQVGTFLSLDSLMITVNWLKDNPDLLQSYLRKRNLAFFPAALVWSFLPIMLAKIAIPRIQGHRACLPIVGGLLIAIAAAGTLSAAGSPMLFAERPIALRGYWHSTFVSLFDLDDGYRNPRKLEVPTYSRLKSEYTRLVFPRGIPSERRLLTELPIDRVRPRHVVIVGLETATRKHYPIIDDPDLVHFHRMSHNAIVNERHYTNTPFTTWAIYSIVSGTYPRPGQSIAKYGNFETDSLASVLSRRGYVTTYIDSYRIDWHEGKQNRKLFSDLGFQQMLDTSDDPVMGNRRTYSHAVQVEEKSFARVKDSILSAEKAGKRAFVFLMTTLGHYQWKAKPEHGHFSNDKKIYEINKEFDRLFGELLNFLDTHGLGKSVIIVATGDHGLRYKDEFASLGYPLAHSDVAFNVPFFLYAPGLIDRQIRLPYVTSHVDIAPTLLDLVGVPTASLFHHGRNMLDVALQERVTFMMNTKLSPVDGFHWNGYYFLTNNLTGYAQAIRLADGEDPKPLNPFLLVHSDIPAPLREPYKVLQSANDAFNLSAAYFLGRKSE